MTAEWGLQQIDINNVFLNDSSNICVCLKHPALKNKIQL